MSMLLEESALEAPQATRKALRSILRNHKSGMVGLGLVLFFIVLAIAAPAVMPYSPTTQSCAVFAPPSVAHWFGCDDGGIDLLSEIMLGGRISLIIGFAATLVSMVIGGGIGVLSGYFGRWVDIVLM